MEQQLINLYTKAQLKEKDVIITEKLNIIEKSSMPAQALSQ